MCSFGIIIVKTVGKSGRMQCRGDLWSPAVWDVCRRKRALREAPLRILSRCGAKFHSGHEGRPCGSVGRQEKKSFSLCRHPVGSGSGIGSVTGAGDTTTGSAGAGAIGAIGSGGFVTRQALK